MATRGGPGVRVTVLVTIGFVPVPRAVPVPPIEKLGRRAWTVRADVACVDDVRAMVEGVLRQLGRLDLLVNNAGIATRGNFAEAPVADYAEMFAIDVSGTMLCSRYAVSAMIERRHGRIINLSSQFAHRRGRDGRLHRLRGHQGRGGGVHARSRPRSASTASP